MTPYGITSKFSGLTQLNQFLTLSMYYISHATHVNVWMPMSWTEINLLKLNWPDNFYLSILTEFYYPPHFVGTHWIWLSDINKFDMVSEKLHSHIFLANTQVTSLYTLGYFGLFQKLHSKCNEWLCLVYRMSL